MIANRLHSRPTPCKGGAALTEYALLTALIAVVAMTSIVALSGQVERIFNRAAFEVSLILGKENYLANGMDDYIAKPIDIQHLKLTLQKYEKELQDQKS